MADRYELHWIDHTGVQWDITSVGWSAGIRAGGIEGLVGQATDVAVTTPGWHGQVVPSQQIEPLTGTLRFAVRADGHRSADDVAAGLRQSFHHRVPGMLVLQIAGVGTYSTGLRLNGFIPPPTQDPSEDEIILGIDVPVVGDEGCWWADALTGTGMVTVTNPGDVPVRAQIRWQGQGGEVTLPSGATFTLPSATQRRTLLLSAAESMAVLTDSGNLDDSLWKQLRGVALPEIVPPGEARTFALPTGATLQWQEGVLNPWR